MAENMKEVYEKINRLTLLSRGYQSAIVITTAVEIELFTVLDARALTSDEVAVRLSLDKRAADIFLHALAGMGLLSKHGEKFSNTGISDQLLVKGRDYYQGDIIRHNSNLIKKWIKLPETLKTGKPPEMPVVSGDKEVRRDFILGMSNIAILSAQKVAEALVLSEFTNMLDLGGGPGTYAITFCRLNPELRAVVFDLPPVIEEVTGNQVAEAGMVNRIALLKGDYLEDNLGSGYDLVLVSNIIHSLGAEENQKLLERCFLAMTAGGKIVVKDFLLDEDRVYPEFSSMFAVNMLMGTSNGGCYTKGETQQWLESAGFKNPELQEISPQARMLIAEKP